MSTEQQTTQERTHMLWTVKDVAEYLRASTSWVYQKAEAGLIPHLPRLPGSSFLRFEQDAIKAYARGEWQPRGR
jgi:excisionase family DNA binding protein